MRPIGAQLCTVETNGWNQLDHSRRGMVAGDAWRLERDCGRTGIAAGAGWQEMDQGRWIKWDGWQSISFPIWSYEVTIECRYACIRCTGGMARCWALFWALFRDTKSCTYMPEFQCRIQSRIRSQVTATMPIPHKPYKINLWRSNDL